MDPIMGEIRYFAFTGIMPSGFLACDGSILQISAYSALFALIGTTYGGDGVSNFALPHIPAQKAGGVLAISTNGIFPS